jgi:ParB-like chromosome segregation protein Spo0J
MTEWNEESALALLFGNTRRKTRSTDLITLAQATDYLVTLYGSQKAVADKLGLSTEMIREFLSALRLPSSVQGMVANRTIDRLDVVRELASLPDKESQVEAARALAACDSKDIRDIKRLVKHGAEVDRAKKAVLSAKPKGFHIFLIDLDDEAYRDLVRSSRELSIDPAELARQIISDWISSRADRESQTGD